MIDIEAWRARIHGWGERMTIDVEVRELRQLLDVVDDLRHRVEMLDLQHEQDVAWLEHTRGEASSAAQSACEWQRQTEDLRRRLSDCLDNSDENTGAWTRTLDQLDYHKARAAFWRTRARAWKTAAKRVHAEQRFFVGLYHGHVLFARDLQSKVHQLHRRARAWKALAKEQHRLMGAFGAWQRETGERAKTWERRAAAWKAAAKLNRGRARTGRWDPRSWPENLFRAWEGEEDPPMLGADRDPEAP